MDTGSQERGVRAGAATGVAAPLGCGLRAEQRAVVPCTVYVCKFKYILLVRGHVWVVSRHVCVICYARSLRPLRGVRTATLRACGRRCAAPRSVRCACYMYNSRRVNRGRGDLCGSARASVGVALPFGWVQIQLDFSL